MTTSDWLQELQAERSRLGRASTAGRVADVLRTRITEGSLAPGTRLSEEDIGTALGVSRNTLREAFRLLGHERLLVHEFNRGVFVRRLTVADVRDLYELRRILECGAVRRAAERFSPGSSPVSDERWTGLLDPVRSAVEEGEAAAGEGRWVDVGTANMHFHQAVSALAGSPRVDEAMGHLLAELRLVFHVMAAPQAFHEAYLPGNRRILELLAAGDLAGAESAMAAYLDAAEAQLVAAYGEAA
ncbi:GntR family transcriptional regulator [Nocardioides sp. Soil805]|uniref:GntR family transcriptional regulator n=1 Tax=Nocardioides sp. Soil805 TaxID=1736416 RepID=UPI000702A576|nr:GntR family transcriptional regulator [Nocardioides sp. Soil805]KRF34118.1 GntR family transcriptional regulator [Nocardioides sp. Soil805]